MLRTTLVLAVGLVIAPACAAAAPQAPWLAGRMVPHRSDVKPRRTLQIDHNADKTGEENGAVLADAIRGLDPRRQA